MAVNPSKSKTPVEPAGNQTSNQAVNAGGEQDVPGTLQQGASVASVAPVAPVGPVGPVNVDAPPVAALKAAERTRIKSLEAFTGVARKPHVLALLVNESPIELEIVGLSGAMSAEADKLTDPIVPPKKVVNGKATEEYDRENPAYQAQMGKVLRLKRAFIFSKGVVGFDVPGETVDAQADALYAALPSAVIDEVVAAVMELTRDSVKAASFI